jgi:hypothetical protein
VVSFLLASGAFPGNRLDNGDTALHVACRCLNDRGLLAKRGGRLAALVARLCTTLAKGGVPVTPNACGETPLHLAAAAGALPVVEALCVNGCPASARAGDGRRAVDVAASAGPVAARVHAFLAARSGPSSPVGAHSGAAPPAPCAAPPSAQTVTGQLLGGPVKDDGARSAAKRASSGTVSSGPAAEEGGAGAGVGAGVGLAGVPAGVGGASGSGDASPPFDGIGLAGGPSAGRVNSTCAMTVAASGGGAGAIASAGAGDRVSSGGGGSSDAGAANAGVDIGSGSDRSDGAAGVDIEVGFAGAIVAPGNPRGSSLPTELPAATEDVAEDPEYWYCDSSDVPDDEDPLDPEALSQLLLWQCMYGVGGGRDPYAHSPRLLCLPCPPPPTLLPLLPPSLPVSSQKAPGLVACPASPPLPFPTPTYPPAAVAGCAPRTCTGRNSILSCSTRCNICQSYNHDVVRATIDTFLTVIASVARVPPGTSEPASLLAGPASHRVVDQEDLTKERRRILAGGCDPTHPPVTHHPPPQSPYCLYSSRSPPPPPTRTQARPRRLPPLPHAPPPFALVPCSISLQGPPAWGCSPPAVLSCPRPTWLHVSMTWLVLVLCLAMLLLLLLAMLMLVVVVVVVMVVLLLLSLSPLLWDAPSETSLALRVDPLLVSRLLHHMKWDGAELCSR